MFFTDEDRLLSQTIGRQPVLFSGVLLLLSTVNLGASEPQRLFINLKPEVHSKPGLIRLGEIASITDEDHRRVRTFSELDVCQLRNGEQQELTREFLSLRLLLASSQLLDIHWSGSKSARLSCEKNADSLLQKIELEVERKISRHLDLPSNEIRIRFLRPLDKIFNFSPEQTPNLVPEVILNNSPLLGKSSVDVRLLADRNVESTRVVPLEIAIRQPELRIVEQIARDTEITPANVEVIESYVTVREALIVPADVYGRVARHNLRVGERLTLKDLEPLNQNPRPDIVVRPRDALRLTARLNNLEYVVPQAEAMQSGQVGQIIRVRNVQSNRIVNARLVSSDEAVVDLK